MSKSLFELQSDMPLHIAQLVVYANSLGYRLVYGDAFRDPRAHGQYGEKMGYASAHSNHKLALAVDFKLFKPNPNQADDWIYCKKTEDYIELGNYWVTLAPENEWGGAGTRQDGNHFSKSWKGRW